MYAMKLALKEWNATVEALGNGHVVAIWRKGGVNEVFKVDQKRFLLFPTFTHQNFDKVKKEFWSTNNLDTGLNKDNQVKIKYWAQVEEEINVRALNSLLNASCELVNSNEYLKSSWNLYPSHKGTILLLRVYALTNPVLITNSKEYGGCKSWIELNIDIPKARSKPVLSTGDFDEKARYINALLDEPFEINEPIMAIP